MKEMTENRSELRRVQRKISNIEECVNLAAKQNLGSISKRTNVTWKYVTYLGMIILWMIFYAFPHPPHTTSPPFFPPSRNVLKSESDTSMENELSTISVNKIKYKGTQCKITSDTQEAKLDYLMMLLCLRLRKPTPKSTGEKSFSELTPY